MGCCCTEPTWRGCLHVGLGALSPEHGGIQWAGTSGGPAHGYTPGPRRPSTPHIVTEALQAQDKRKGASIVAIKRFILAKYPTVDPGHLGDLLKQALSKGLSCGDLVRPHNSSAMGATGRFKVDRGLLAWVPWRGHCPGWHAAPSPAGAAGGSLATAKQKPRTKPVDVSSRAAWRGWVARAWQEPEVLSPLQAPPPAAAKTRSDGAKPPRAARQPRAPSKGHSGSPVALKVRGGGGGSPGGAGAKGSQAALVGKSRAKAPGGHSRTPPRRRGTRARQGSPGAPQKPARAGHAAGW
uniref:H15 domain-containing protein n=1 Tax=Falco tinnunculus TaxID=100819 RepID=A0A8C4U015_FALTI